MKLIYVFNFILSMHITGIFSGLKHILICVNLLFRTYNTHYTFGEKFANFNEFYNGYKRIEQLLYDVE